MHAANLLNKKRQREAEKDKHHGPGTGTPAGGAGTPTASAPTTKHQNSKQHLLVDSQSQSNSSMVAGGTLGGASPMPPRHHIPGPVVDYTSDTSGSRQCQSTSASCIHHPPKKQKKKNYQPSKQTDNTSNAGSTGVPTTHLYYHKEEHFNCAHVGLCIMILGVIIMTITGFVSHMLGFGEPGIIIVTGGACFCAVGLFLLCFGNAWYIRRSTKKAGLLHFIEIGRGASFDGNVVP